MATLSVNANAERPGGLLPSIMEKVRCSVAPQPSLRPLPYQCARSRWFHPSVNSAALESTTPNSRVTGSHSPGQGRAAYGFCKRATSVLSEAHARNLRLGHAEGRHDLREVIRL